MLRAVPWIRTSDGLRTVRETLLGAHRIAGLEPGLNGIEVGTFLRVLTSVASLVLRHQSSSACSFQTESVDAVLEMLSPASNLFDPEWPFMQTTHDGSGITSGPKAPVKKLYPWMPGDRAEEFWTGGSVAKEFDTTAATLALAVHYHYSFGGNNRIDGRACVNGSPGIRYPGVGYTATEVLWRGETLFETLLMNTPRSWVGGDGLPAWADPVCARSKGGPGEPEHPLWRATWGSNTAQCLWDGGVLTAVSTGGSVYLPPTMGAGKEAAKAWWDHRNTEDTFYLYADIETKNAAGTVTSVQRRAQRLDLGHQETDLAVEWNAKGLSSAVRSRSKGTVRTPGRGTQLMFLRHLVEGSASSPVVRRTEVLISSAKKWMVDEDRADAVADAASLVKAVCSELSKPFTVKGRLTALRDRRTDAETAFWLKVSAPFEDFIINGAGSAVDPAIWPLVRSAAIQAFDEVVSSAPGAKLAPFIMTARNRVSWNISQVLGLTGQRAA
ncbi:type I-E CRISPR-associated protein Cse1/CasA [Arthrobacter sp. ISL-28]|uniref:type I-E CRISPR-associated protein Cse1/CasA n=1 Tax=Arthrobacter sp. ISL-28 TaxID=2819108 RepID=UPI00288988C3|nr:type I-E CRISPR-associated protein Cse1/CasA [Arthrobacter sp. ISL-28]